MITVFAKTNFRSQEEVFGIKTDDRRRHMYIIGKTGMGKTNLLQTMIIQDIYAGNGLAYIDPHGDTAEELLKYIPKNRINDVVYFNPADLDYPIAFNVLENVNEEHKHLIASGMMGVFKKIWPDVWSPRMEHILNYTLLALLDYPGSTMLGINRMLSDKQFRNKVLNKVQDPIVRSFWVNEFAKWNERYMNEAIAPIQNKVGQFIATPVIRNIVSQTKSTLRMRDIMDNGKILIVNLSKGRIGEEAMQLLGGMVVTKLQLAAMERVDIDEEKRKDFYMFVDEFQNFATESFANILSEARKYRLNLTLAHQYIGQLIKEGNTYVRDAVFGNVGTLISFRIGAEDAEVIEKEFEPVVSVQDLVNLPKYNVYLKLMIDGIAGGAFSASTLPPLAAPLESDPDKVIKVSRQRYGKDRKVIEGKISRWSLNEDQKSQLQKQNFKETQKPEKADKNKNKDLHKAKCDNCNVEILLPFKPDGIRETFCKKCFQELKQAGKLKNFSKSKKQKAKVDSSSIRDLINDAKNAWE
ncbi:MAG: type IV secretion system DNA-binding domain-containing protein [Candidatus Moranbacteria bacterium]|nr:type IV secretion system DNA-binding domain-containing protein [Candidatus Moranbacteria bacterium]